MVTERNDEPGPDIESLLESGLDLPRAPDGLRESLLLRTSALVRTRARQRRMALSALCAAAAILVFAAGFGSARLLEGEPGAPDIASATPVAPPDIGSMAEAEPPVDPDTLRRLIPSSPPGERREMLRRAGDAYMARGDLEEALECYRQVIEIDGTDPPGGAAVGETWLLAAMKQARDRENRRRS